VEEVEQIARLHLRHVAGEHNLGRVELRQVGLQPVAALAQGEQQLVRRGEQLPRSGSEVHRVMVVSGIVHLEVRSMDRRGGRLKGNCVFQ
jgi:hypothetical protein